MTRQERETTVKPNAKIPPVATDATPTPAPPAANAGLVTDPSMPAESRGMPVGLLPTPTREYRQRRKVRRAALATGTPVRTPIPPPVIPGARVLMWKWDPGDVELDVRTAFLPGHILPGPRDARIEIDGVPPVVPNVLGDLIATPGTDTFDAIHTFAVVRRTLTLYQHALFPTSVPWQWNNRGNTEPIRVYPRAGEAMNAFYSRKEQALKFFSFTPPGAGVGTPPVRTCRSQDLVAHETAHAVLDGLKPQWILADQPPQTGALHEAFADLTTIFLMLSQPEQVAAIVMQTKANLHHRTFLADLAEDPGLALGRPTGLRTVDNELTLGQVGTEVYDLAQVFTGAIYDVLADIVAFELKPNADPTAVVYAANEYVAGLLIRALTAAPDSAASFADVVNQMLNVTELDDKPVQYRNFIRRRFVLREVVESPTALTGDHVAGDMLDPKVRDAADAVQTRYACCGTLQHPQYAGADTVAPEIEEFVRGLSTPSSGGKR
jgi:hypothetical protein